jgi:hypothetical protein
MKIVSCLTVLLAVLALLSVTTAKAQNAEYVTVSGKQFVLSASGAVFVPWGNDEGYPGYADDIQLAQGDWPQLVANFQYLKLIGTNTVRIFPQLGEIMGNSPTTTNAQNLQLLANIINLADSLDMRIDITGLDVLEPSNSTMDPPWYDSLSETDRWAVQARYWSAVAQTVMSCPGKNAVFCYDLTNEPCASGSDQTTWYTGLFGGDYFDQYLVQNIDDPKTHKPRTQSEIVKQWIDNLTTAIRKYDTVHLITVGNLPRAGYYGGFDPQKTAHLVNFISTHNYPSSGQVNAALSDLDSCVTGKPILVEETMDLSCGSGDESQFLLRSNIDNGGKAAGWIGHYQGTTIAQYTARIDAGTESISDILVEEWLIEFENPTDPYFSIPTVAPSQIAADPGGVLWVFGGPAGIAADGSSLTSNNPSPPDNTQVAYVQPSGTISQSLFFKRGQDYQIELVAAGQANEPAPTIEISVNGKQVGTLLTLSSSNYDNYSTVPFKIGDIASGFYTLSIVGGGQANSTALIDEVQLVPE